MDIPESIVRVPVVGNLLRVVLDSRDSGSVPDARELPNLRAVVEATVPYIEGGEHDLYIMDRFVFHTNQVGEIVNPASPDDAPEVPATTGNGPEFLYQVQLLWDGQTEKQKNLFLWRATAAESLNLGRVINAPTPEDIPRWMQAMVEVADARQEISGWRDDVELMHGEVVELTAGNVLNDDIVSDVLGWSSQKIDDEKANKTHNHSAGQITSGTLASARLPAASTTARGAVELATEAESVAGENTRAVTGLGVLAVVKDRAVVADPEDYGVNVTGANAETEFQAMVTSLPAGSEIRMRPGQTVKLASEVVLDRPLTVTGGTIIPAAGTKTLTVGSDDVTIEGVKFAGTRTGTPAVGEYFISSDATSPDTYRGVKIRDNTLEGMNHSGIWVTGLTDFEISGNRISQAEYAGIMGLSVRNGRVSGNKIYDLHQGGSLVNSYGVAISDSLNTRAARSEHVVVDGNHVDGVPDWTALDTHSGFDIKFLNNTTLNCRNGVAVTAGNAERTTAPEACYVAGNYIEKGNANSESAAIVFTGKTGGELPDRITYGMIGTNTIIGYEKDLIYNLYDPNRMVIQPQVFDGAWSGRFSPVHPTWRELTFNVTIPVTSSPSGSVEYTFPAGYFAPGVNPQVQVTRSGTSNADYIVFESAPTPTSVRIWAYHAQGTAATASIVARVTVTQVSPTALGIPRP